jgi:hypothetical protein
MSTPPATARGPAREEWLVAGLAALAALLRVAVACGAPRPLVYSGVAVAAAAAVVVALRGRGAWLDRWRLALVLLLLLELPSVYPRLGGDGFEYFAVARSLLFDRDLDLANDFAGLGATPVVSPLGQVTARTPLGLSLLWMPAIALAHAGTWVAAVLGAPFAADGFSRPYTATVTMASFLFGAAALLLVEGLVRRLYGPPLALLAALALWLATPLQFYAVANPFMSHAASTFAAAVLVAAWWRWRERVDARPWLWIGLLGAVMTLVRIQDGVLLALPLVDLLARLRRPGVWRRLFALAAGPALGAVVQALVWVQLWSVDFARIITTQGPGFRLRPEWVGVLFSPRHGLFTWTPLYALAVAGWLLWLKRDRRLALTFMAVFAAAVGLNAAMGDWWGPESFGQRRLLGLTPLFALGLAETLALALRRPVLPVAALLAAAALWNYQLAAVYNAELAGRRGEAIHLDRLLAAQGTLLERQLVRWEGRLPRGLWLLAYDAVRGVWLDEGTRSLGGRLDLGGDEPPDLAAVLAHNWARPEVEEGVGFRRAKGALARLRVPIRVPGDFTLRIRLRSEKGEAPLEMEVQVNGQSVGRAAVEAAWTERAFPVPAALLRPGFNDVAFAFPAVAGGSAAGRRARDAAAAVDWIAFERAPGTR